MNPAAAPLKPLAAVVITAAPAFFAASLGALTDAAERDVVTHGELDRPPSYDEPSLLYVEAVSRARRALRGRLAITAVQAATFAGAVQALVAAGTGAGPVGPVFVDAASLGLENDEAGLEAALEGFYAALAAAGVPVVRSPYAVLVHQRRPPWSDGAHALPDRWLSRVAVPEQPWLMRIEQLVAFVDFFERTFDKPRNHKTAVREIPTTLGDEVVRFMEDRAAADWLLFYFTGSSVAPLIDHVERISSARGVTVLRGANEHALACGALANHLLHDRPFVMLVGTAMMDELRGTLANLRTAGARGFIICPESEEGAWFTFQGTISPDEDMRASLTARGTPCVYLDRPETMPERLEEAFRHYEEGRGPVVLLVTQAILDARDPLPRRPIYPERAGRASGAAVDEPLRRVLTLLNQEQVKVLWQAGRLDAEEQELAEAIAARAGVALVDTLGHPAPSHRGGRRIENHLGTLGLYGFNQRSYAFLHPGGKLGPREEQCLFFIKSKVGQRATNFTPFRRTGLRMIQVTDRADHVAPDVELAVVMEARDFLRRVLAGLDVAPSVLRFRQEAIRAASAPPADLASRIPSLPMSPNYFFAQLGGLVERMITEDGYDYTGVYDVGRNSVSALRAVPRTRRGFSGWYGRALMGDAPAALSTLALTEPGNVCAFIGDGGRAIVADPLPHLLENALAHPDRADKNVSVFYFSNGTYSGIRTYRERLSSRWGGRQIRCLDLLDEEGDRTFGPLTVSRRRLTSFDPVALREALLAPRRLNVLTVVLAHNNDDDGFSFVTSDWQRG